MQQKEVLIIVGIVIIAVFLLSKGELANQQSMSTGNAIRGSPIMYCSNPCRYFVDHMMSNPNTGLAGYYKATECSDQFPNCGVCKVLYGSQGSSDPNRALNVEEYPCVPIWGWARTRY